MSEVNENPEVVENPEAIESNVPDVELATNLSDVEMLLAIQSILTPEQLEQLTPQQTEQIAGLQSQVKVAKVEQERALFVKNSNDALLISARLYRDSLTELCPSFTGVKMIEMSFDYDNGTQLFSPTDGLPRASYKSEKFISNMTIDLYNAVVDGVASKTGKAEVKKAFNVVGLENDIEDFTTVIADVDAYRNTELPKLTEHYSDDRVKTFMSDISIPERYKEHISFGNVTLRWTCATQREVITQEENEEPIKTMEDVPEKWTVINAKFGKSSPKSTGTGTRTSSKTVAWIPSHLADKVKSQKDYLQVVFGDDPKVIKKLASITEDKKIVWKKLNISQYLLTLEKTVPQAQRYYTNSK